MKTNDSVVIKVELLAEGFNLAALPESVHQASEKDTALVHVIHWTPALGGVPCSTETTEARSFVVHLKGPAFMGHGIQLIQGLRAKKMMKNLGGCITEPEKDAEPKIEMMRNIVCVHKLTHSMP